MGHRGLAFVALSVCLVSCAKRDNETYVNYLATLVVRYQERHGTPPDTFETAHDESGVILANRGDAYGRPLAYYKLGDRGFMFRAYGPNGQDNLGLADDLDIYYLDKQRVSRDKIIKYLKSLDYGNFWPAVYRPMFEGEVRKHRNE